MGNNKKPQHCFRSIKSLRGIPQIADKKTEALNFIRSNTPWVTTLILEAMSSDSQQNACSVIRQSFKGLTKSALNYPFNIPTDGHLYHIAFLIDTVHVSYLLIIHNLTTPQTVSSLRSVSTVIWCTPWLQCSSMIIAGIQIKFAQ